MSCGMFMRKFQEPSKTQLLAVLQYRISWVRQSLMGWFHVDKNNVMSKNITLCLTVNWMASYVSKLVQNTGELNVNELQIMSL